MYRHSPLVRSPLSQFQTPADASQHSRFFRVWRFRPGRPLEPITQLTSDNAAMLDQMLTRKPLPHPELEEQRKAPLQNIMPGAEAAEKDAKENADQTPPEE